MGTLTHDRREFLQLGALAGFGALGSDRLADVPIRFERDGGQEVTADWPGLEVRVRQEPGKTAHWVLPGRRQISEYVFGTPENPRTTGQHWVNVAEGPVKELLEAQTFQVGLPVEQRRTNDDGSEYTITEILTGYSDSARETEGELDVTYVDRQPYDTPGEPGDTLDTAEVTARFEDPAGNEYEVVLDHVVKPPFPPWETGGGVVTGTWLHGVTGTGTPLMPRLFNYAALWGVGALRVNGEVAEEGRVIHFMTTENVRKADSYALALDEEVPLSEDERYLGHPHHTHLFLPPIKATPEGPQVSPVPTEFELPNGENQPFVHYMWDEDTIAELVVRGAGEMGETTTTEVAEQTTAQETTTADEPTEDETTTEAETTTE